jgi:deoxyribodipyrimidine photo-lyase
MDSKLEHTGGSAKWWIKKSLLSLQDAMKIEGIPLIVSSGNYMDILKEIIERNKIEEIVSQCVPYRRTLDFLNNIKEFFSKKGVLIKYFEPNNLLSLDEIYNMELDFHNYDSFWERVKDLEFQTEKSNELPTFEPEVSGMYNITFLPWEKKLSKYWTVNEKEAQRLLNNLKKSADVKDRYSSKISPYIRHGQINVKALWNILKANDSSNEQNEMRLLAMREFYTISYYRRPLSSTLCINKKFEDFPWSSNWRDLLEWKGGNTNIPVIDNAMKDLWERGWIDHRLRNLVSNFLVKEKNIKWSYGAQWFMDTLVDADEPINYSLWQNVAGTGDFS